MIHTIEWNGRIREVNDQHRIFLFEDKEGLKAMMFMPGYNDIVMIPVSGPRGWHWNCDRKVPTFSPSILDPGGAGRVRSHVFVRDGVIEYLHDCGHELAGKKLELPCLKDWPEDMKYW